MDIWEDEAVRLFETNLALCVKRPWSAQASVHWRRLKMPPTVKTEHLVFLSARTVKRLSHHHLTATQAIDTRTLMDPWAVSLALAGQYGVHAPDRSCTFWAWTASPKARP